MKKLLFILTLVTMVVSCGKHMYNTSSSGQADQSYIVVLSNNKDVENIIVDVDGVQHTIGKVYPTKLERKAHPVVISTGRHNVKIVVNGEVKYNENIFLGVQQTKKIVL